MANVIKWIVRVTSLVLLAEGVIIGWYPHWLPDWIPADVWRVIWGVSLVIAGIFSAWWAMEERNWFSLFLIPLVAGFAVGLGSLLRPDEVFNYLSPIDYRLAIVITVTMGGGAGLYLSFASFRKSTSHS